MRLFILIGSLIIARAINADFVDSLPEVGIIVLIVFSVAGVLDIIELFKK